MIVGGEVNIAPAVKLTPVMVPAGDETAAVADAPEPVPVTLVI